MVAKLPGLDEIDWGVTHPNGPPEEIPRQLRRWARGEGFDGEPRGGPPAVLSDLLVHQETRFDGGALAMPYIVELALDSDTPSRSELVWLASAIGLPVERDGEGVEIDREAIAALTDEELFGDLEHADAYLLMCEIDGRRAWLEQLHRLSPLVEDADPQVQMAAIVSLADEESVPSEHEARLRTVVLGDGELGWHATLALGLLGATRGLEPESLVHLRERLAHQDLVQRVTAACALILAGETSAEARALLDEREARFDELARHRCAFRNGLTGLLARARHQLDTETDANGRV